MGLFSSKKETSQINWVHLTSSEQLNQLLASETPIALFKHSTRCSISHMAKSKFERNWKNEFKTIPVYLDLIAYRSISNEIAEKLDVIHQSPQLIVVENEKVTHHASHNAIGTEFLK